MNLLAEDEKEYIEICAMPNIRNGSFDNFRERVVLSKRMDIKDIAFYEILKSRQSYAGVCCQRRGYYGTFRRVLSFICTLQ